MKKVFFAFVAAATIALVSCNNKPAEETTTEQTATETTEAPAATTEAPATETAPATDSTAAAPAAAETK